MTSTPRSSAHDGRDPGRLSGTALARVDNAQERKLDQGHDRYFVKCRRVGCGQVLGHQAISDADLDPGRHQRPHPIRERAVPCRYCRTDCWDHHAVCARCHAAEALEENAERIVALVEEHTVT